MTSEDILPNILRAMLFAGIIGVVFLVLGMMSSYSIDSTDIHLATFQERISDAIQSNTYNAATGLDIQKIITSSADPQTTDQLGIRVTIGSEEPKYYNKNYFDANYASGSGIKANVRSRTAYRLLTTTDAKTVLVAIDIVGLRV